jgi:ABC-type phosphate transport system substrate-binding protein
MIKLVRTGALLLGLLSTTAMADVVVVVNKANSSALDQKTVQRIFLGKDKKFPDGSPLTAINQSAESPTRASFDERVLGRNSSQVSAYWSKLVFTGKGVPPMELPNDQAVIEKVASTPDAIGYVDSTSVTDSVTVININ